MKNIALIRESVCELGGTERVMINLSNGLSEYFNCFIITLFQDKRIPFQIDNNISLFNLYSHRRKLRFIVFDSVKKIGKFVKKQNIDTLIVIGRSSSVIPLLVKIFYGIKIIYCEHGMMPAIYYKFTIKEKIYNYIFSKMIKLFSDKIVLLNKNMQYIYQKQYKINSDQLRYIYNFIDTKYILDKETYEINSRKIISVGRINCSKGYEYLIEVAAIVIKKHPEWQWHIYGEGEEKYKNKLKKIVSSYKLDKNIIFMGTLNNIEKIYHQYSFFVLTSRHEGMPMVLLEAKGSHLPIVSFDIETGPSDIIRDNIDGFLVKPFDIDDMSNKICQLIENLSLRQQFSNNAHGNLDKFKKETVIKQWINLIEEVGNYNAK